MKIRKAIHIIILAVAVAAIGACKGSNKFEIDGQLLNMDQGTIYVYSSDGLIQNIDTILIKGGRFEYVRSIDRDGTLMLVFPNFSEIPVFAEPGEDIELKGNAQQLNKLTVNGTNDNKLMTTFRIGNFEQSPQEIKKNAEDVIKNNPQSIVSTWLLEKYFIKCAHPDYKKALQYAKDLRKQQQDNGHLAELILNLEVLSKSQSTGTLKFSANDINGNKITNETVKGKKTIIYTSAYWDYDNDVDRNVKQYINSENYDFNAIRISLDASIQEIKDRLQFNDDGEKIKIICQEKLFNSPIMKTLGLGNIGESIILDANGKILKRNAQSSEIERLLK